MPSTTPLPRHQDKFDYICDAVLAIAGRDISDRSSRDLIRKSVVELMAMLAHLREY